MKHCGTKQIETKRLLLRRFTLEDAPAMYRNWASDETVTTFLRWPPHESVEVTKQILTDWVKQYGHEDYYQWAIVSKDTLEPIGSIGAVEQDDHIEMAHIGYCIGSAWWHQGITSEALAAIMHFFFEIVGVNRLESQHDPNNPNSGKVMIKCGMRYEGCHRQADWSNQGICDCCVYAILKEEYEQYKSATSLSNRISIHDRYSINKDSEIGFLRIMTYRNNPRRKRKNQHHDFLYSTDHRKYFYLICSFICLYGQLDNAQESKTKIC